MRELRVDYGQASIVKSNMSMSLSYLEDEISKINSAINEIESLNRSYGKTSIILNELYDQKKKAQQSYDEMQEFNEKFSKFISNVKTTDTELAKKFTSDVKTYCKKNNIEITSELDAFLDKVQVALDLAGWLPIVGDVADGINAAISLCRGNYLEALICVVAMLPFGDMVKSLKYADEAKGILKYGDEFLKGVKTVAKEGSEKLSKQMSKVIKSGKLDNVIASMDAGKHYIVKMRDGTVTAIEKTGLPEKIGMCLGNGCFIAGTLVTTRSGLRPIEEIKIGDYVLSRNEETGEDSYKKVTDTLVRSTQEICTIELKNGKINSTTGHLFMVKDKWWKAVVKLVTGDVLVTSDGEDQIVKSIKVEEKGYPVTTYNLTVEDNHTFFVGTEKVLNHNTIKLLKDCNYTKEVSESITEKLSNTEAHNYVNYIKYKGELAKSELKEMYPDFVAKKNSRIAQTSDTLLKKELEFAPYGELEKIPFDNLTGHHMPSNYYMKEKFNIDTDDSLAFNLEQLTPGVGGRHRRTFTYGFKDRGKELYLNLMPRDALTFDINDIRRILKEDGLYNSESRKALSEYINYYKKMAPGVFKK